MGTWLPTVGHRRQSEAIDETHLVVQLLLLCDALLQIGGLSLELAHLWGTRAVMGACMRRAAADRRPGP